MLVQEEIRKIRAQILSTINRMDEPIIRGEAKMAQQLSKTVRNLTEALSNLVGIEESNK